MGTACAVLLPLRPGLWTAEAQLRAGRSTARRVPGLWPPLPATLTPVSHGGGLAECARVWKLVGGRSILALLIVVAVIAITGFPQAGGDGDLGGHRKVEAQAVHVHAAAVERARAGV